MAKCPYCRHDLDLSKVVSDDELYTELGKRRVKYRVKRGVIWKEHNPLTLRCRCEDCMLKRGYTKAQIDEIRERGSLKPVRRRRKPKG